MKVLNKLRSLNTFTLSLSILIFISFLSSCDDDLLNQTPKSSLGPANTLNSKGGFEAYLVGLVSSARAEMSRGDNLYFRTNFPATDIAADAEPAFSVYRNWNTYMTPNNGEVRSNWDWAYSDMISQANTIIAYANSPEAEQVWASSEEKNAVLAEAKFFRAYTYNYLANLYGGVPIVDTLQAQPKFDFERAKRNEVYEFAQSDLEFAVQWLPETVPPNKEGRIVRAAAAYLLTKIDISLGQYDKAIESALTVINSGNYNLMRNRFGSSGDEPGDVFSDLFKDGNYNRSSGNMESIYVWQFAENIEGGGGDGNPTIRNIAPFLTQITDPDGVANIPTDELGRGVGRVRGTNYSIQEIWTNSEDDIRNSEYNFRRNFYFNNPESSYFGENISEVIDLSESSIDNTNRLYAYPRKIEGPPWEGNNASGRTTKDKYVYRLAGLYLLRAEAYLMNGEKQKAADDINIIRSRAQASPIDANDVDIDFILDERARELMYEVSRRRTLMRMGKLVERVRKYGYFESSRSTVQDHNNLWPIPQTAIDANFANPLEQNPGYN